VSFEMPTRLVIAYGLIAVMLLAAAGFAWWRARNTHERRDARARARQAARYRVRDEANAGAATER
jgi:hypothetical protein